MRPNVLTRTEFSLSSYCWVFQDLLHASIARAVGITISIHLHSDFRRRDGDCELRGH